LPITHSEDETIELGKKIGKGLDKPVVLAVRGELGAGKTFFVKGIARGLNVGVEITSPTFLIVKTYPGRIMLHHIDLYRVFSINEIPFIEEYLYSEGVCAIEWPERIEEILPENRIEVNISIVDEHSRRIEIDDYRN